VRWLHKTDVRHARRLERWIVDNYDLTITVSEEDSLLLRGRPIVVPNGVDLSGSVNTPLPPEPSLVFIGSFNWLPNIDGAQWFCREVLPRVRREVPSAIVHLVGREPERRVVELSDIPGVETHFDVPTVRPFLESARVALVPLRMGSGTRLKALEAMAAGRPVAGTSVGLEGLGLVDGQSAAVADTARALAAGIVRLCRDDDYATRLSGNARNLAESRFSWEKIASSYVETVMSAAVERRGAQHAPSQL
jgi:glycosyltransferase involved in cell wall biosynthesis